MKNYFFVCLLFFVFNTRSQEFCGTDKFMQSFFESNKNLKEEFNRRRLEINSISKNNPFDAIATTIYTIPVVFHILHQYGIENISDAQIKDQINILNRDYRKQNSDTASIIAPFQAADVRVQFVLATRDTNGNCTTGIVRHYDPNTIWTSPNPSNYAYTWNSTKYLNIYVVKQITGFSAGGYASPPGLNPGAMDVIVLMNNSIGSIGTSYPFRSRILTHEVGHWLGLEHIWGNAQVGVACGDDGINDTPVTKGFNICPGGSPAICNPLVVENYQNYMDYSFCSKMFTAGQAAYMVATLNSTVSGRNNLWTNSNLIATGVINPSYSCAPIADCSPSSFTVCSGVSLTLHDASYNGTVTSWSWTATGGAVITNSTVSTPTVIFPSAGIQTIGLTVANGSGTSTASNTVAVINGIANVSVNYPESFENAGLPANFKIINPDNDITWSQTSQAAATGTNSYFISGNADAPNSFPDFLETPSYDFSIDPNASFTFKYAYAKLNASNKDQFKVLASKNCGATWEYIYAPSNSAMASNSGGTTNSPFFPSPSQFVTYTLTDDPNFFPYLGQPNVRFRFYFKEDSISGYGNNIFLDDINFNSTNMAGVHELSKYSAFKIYPNPSSASEKIKLEITFTDDVHFSYHISSLLGETMATFEANLSSGHHTIPLNNVSSLGSGVYILNISTGNGKLSKKLIIE